MKESKTFVKKKQKNNNNINNNNITPPLGHGSSAKRLNRNIEYRTFSQESPQSDVRAGNDHVIRQIEEKQIGRESTERHGAVHRAGHGGFVRLAE